MEKNFVLDTNVLIHNPQAIYSFADNRVIIPITVIEELDHFKSSADKKGMHARQVLREIDGLIKKGALRKGAKMSNGGTLMIAFGPKDIELPPDMDASLEDNKILAVAWKLQQDEEAVFFISKDVNARIKAEALGIRSSDYEKQKVEYGSLFQGWRELVLCEDDIRRLDAQNKLMIKGQTFMPNEYILVKSDPDADPVKACQYDPV